MAKKLTETKAKTMLKDNSAQGHPLTDKQKRYFGYIAGGGKPKRSITIPKKELVEEHRELVQKLKHGSRASLKKEASKQQKELSEYEKARNAKRKLQRGMRGQKR